MHLHHDEARLHHRTSYMACLRLTEKRCHRSCLTVENSMILQGDASGALNATTSGTLGACMKSCRKLRRMHALQANVHSKINASKQAAYRVKAATSDVTYCWPEPHVGTQPGNGNAAPASTQQAAMFNSTTTNTSNENLHAGQIIQLSNAQGSTAAPLVDQHTLEYEGLVCSCVHNPRT
jgi:hypothetical protein